MVALLSVEMIMQKLDSAELRVRISSPNTADTGKVRLGAQAPSFPPRIVKTVSAAAADTGKVRLGAQAPSLPPRK